MCSEREPFPVDDGTMCLVRTPSPAPTGVDSPVPVDVTPAAVPLTPEDQEILEKVARMRSWADKLGFTQAVKALDHYLSGTGTFVEIPAEKVKTVRKESEASHKEKLLKAIQGHFGAPTMLALQGLVDDRGKVKAQKDWPDKVEFTMDYTSGTAKAGVSDDNLAYYGSMIKSEVSLRCTRKKGKMEYDCQITQWRSWIVDNYDWEGDKKFGGDNPVIRWLLPTQKQMNRLAEIGRAKPYQRSSRSWKMPFDANPWTIEYVNNEEIEFKAKDRKSKLEERKATQKKEFAEGSAAGTRPGRGGAAGLAADR